MISAAKVMIRIELLLSLAKENLGNGRAIGRENNTWNRPGHQRDGLRRYQSGR